MKLLIMSLITPPGISIFLCLLALYFFGYKRKLSAYLLLAAIVFGWVFSTSAMGRLLATGLIAHTPTQPAYERLRRMDLDMIVVLTRGNTLTGSGEWIPSADTYQRVAQSFEIQDKVSSRVPLLISGGKTYGHRYPSEAAVAKNYFTRSRAQVTPVLIEETSLNTKESALEVSRILKENVAKDVLLVTDELHMLRSLAAYRARGINPIAYPVYVLQRGEMGLADYLPSWRGVTLNAKVLREIYGIAGYVLSGDMRLADVFDDGVVPVIVK